MSTELIDFLIQVAATVVGGIILTAIFFLAKDILFKLPNINGLWTLNLLTKSSAYNLYKSMQLTYIVLLAQEGNIVLGTGEKIKEITTQGEKNYEGKDRIHIEIQGYITKRYITKDEIIIHIKETGELRNSSSVHSLKLIGRNSLCGAFVSTIANSSGTAKWIQGNDNYQFSTI